MYILIAYKPDADDICRGCLMSSYSSDFVFEKDLDEESLIEQMANLMVENRYKYNSYNFWVIKNGISIIEEDHPIWNEPVGNSIYSKAKSLSELLIKEKEEARVKKRFIEDSINEARELENRKALFEKLKKEFNE